MENTENTFKVCIKCFTFNHVNYIEDAMHGFVMQQTDFPYVTFIADDASTDGEQDVIKRFLEREFDMRSAQWNETEDYQRVVVKHKTNINCTFVVSFLKYNHYSIKKAKKPYFVEWSDNAKYIAMCEGDDYWTDPLKLQKQVDFLEEHEEYSMCFHFVNVDSEIEKETYFFDHLTERDYPPEDFYDRWAISTCSILYRRDLLDRVYVPSKFVVYGDMYMFLLLSEVGKIRCLGFPGSTYRRHSGSMSHLCNHQMLGNISKQYRWYTSRFGYNPKLKQLSIKQEKQYLSFIINDIAYKDTWRYRFRYMCLCPKLFLSKFHLVTIFKYFLFRPCLVKKNSKKS